MGGGPRQPDKAVIGLGKGGMKGVGRGDEGTGREKEGEGEGEGE